MIYDHKDAYPLAIVVNKELPPWENRKVGMRKSNKAIDS
jgi:hypothetical protein